MITNMIEETVRVIKTINNIINRCSIYYEKRQMKGEINKITYKKRTIFPN